MNLNPPPDPRSSMWSLMAYYLRFQRMEHGITAAELSKILKCSEATTSRLESGKQPMKQEHAERVDKAWRTGDLFTTLLYYARRASDPNWFKTFTQHEGRARRIRIFAGQIMPGLVQTEDYTRALMTTGRNRNVEANLAKRMARQLVLDGPNPPDVWIYLTENVLEWVVGGHEAHRRQLQHLLDLSQLPHAIVRVIRKTSGAGEFLDGPFLIITGKDGEEVAFVEAPKEGRLVTDSSEVEDFKDRFERIGAQALPENQSRELITEVMKGL